MTKVALNELTERDLAELAENPTVWDKIVNAISEDTTNMLEDFISRLKGVFDYSISDSSNCDNCLAVANSYLFLSSLKEACSYNAGVLSDKQLDTAAKLVNDCYNSADDDDNEIEELQDKMDKLAGKYADILVTSMVADYDVIYDTDYVKDYMKEELPNMYPDGAYYNREDNSIYYITKD